MSENKKTSVNEDRGENTDPVVTSRSSDCYVAANRLLLGQYRVQVSGKDAELMAKDRYEVAVALIEQRGELDQLRDYKAAIDRGGWDISTCRDCNELVVCLPDGFPMCESCATKAT